MAADRKVLVPDLGDFEDVEVVEVLVQSGQRVESGASLIVLESDKASMEVPAPFAGVVKRLEVSVGDRVNEGSLIAIVEAETEAEGEEASETEAEGEEAFETEAEGEEASETAPEGDEAAGPEARARETPGPGAEEEDGDRPGAGEKPERARPAEARRGRTPEPETRDRSEPREEAPQRGPAPPPGTAHASPSVRRLARELGVDLTLVPGSGRKGRILKDDVQGYVKSVVERGGGIPIAGVSVVRAPDIDFAKYGPTETQPLNRIRKVAGANLLRSWVTVPHVTQFDEADATELEAFRQAHKASAEARGVKLTFVPFLVKACAAALLEFPHFNASLDRTGENLILKRYVHVGVAVDTPHGLVVPVLRDADRKGILTLAEELQDLSTRARERKLRPADLEGGTFSISSLGGIGGTLFTPIVNHPEVAILGVSRMAHKPVWRDDDFVPRLVLPLSLSYDHRVIDGADAARFTTRLAQLLADLRLLIL